MAYCANDFEPSSLVVQQTEIYSLVLQQTEIYYVDMLDIGATTT
jgi:hypothetical protein